MKNNSRVILIVDDEEQIGMLASVCLGKLGFITLLASSAEAALSHWHDHPGEIDMLLTDLAMPDLRGDKLAEKLLNEKPDLRVFFMSGSPLRSGEISFALNEGQNFLHKPFSRETLINLFRKELPVAAAAS
jgi:two-component system, cell cycle sensor histidine kinase and response regulator CckA